MFWQTDTESTLLEYYLYAMYGKYKYLDKLAISESDLKPIGNLNHVCGPPKAESVFVLAKNDFKKKHWAAVRATDWMSWLDEQISIKIFCCQIQILIVIALPYFICDLLFLKNAFILFLSDSSNSFEVQI